MESPKYRDSYKLNSKRALVRDADDCVIFAETRKDAEKAKADATRWLAARGRVLSEEKTTTRHLSEGFDLLGGHVRHYLVTNTKTGYKLLIKPSQDAIKDFKYRMKREWKHSSATTWKRSSTGGDLS